MPTTLQDIQGYLDQAGYDKYDLQEEKSRIVMSFNMQQYTNPDGEKSVRVLIVVTDEGRACLLLIPRLYVHADEPNGPSVLKTLLYCAYLSEGVSFSLDVADGEIRASVRILLEDAALTFQQFRGSLDKLLSDVDSTHGMVVTAKETGEIKPIESGEERIERLARSIGELSDDSGARVRTALDGMIAKDPSGPAADAPESL